MIEFALKNMISSQGLTQKSFAEKIGVREATVSAICNNKLRELPIDVLDKICDFFECSAGDIIIHFNPVNMEERRKEEGNKYLIEFSTRKQREQYVKDGIAISTLDAKDPSPETMELLEGYISGNQELEEVKKEVINRYLENREVEP